MNEPFLQALLVGLPQSFGRENATEPMDRPWTSGIFKNPVEGPVWLGKTNLDGDGQADQKHHGGPEKAVLAYAASHYPLWQQEMGLTHMTYGGFGENFAIMGLTEQEVCIGDTFRIGDAIVQVSQPRQPCWKLARRWRIKDLAARAQATGRTGWYFRVLQEGYVEKGQPIIRIEQPFPEWTVARCNEVMHVYRHDRQLAAQLASCPLLAENWGKTLTKRAEHGKNSDPEKRLVGPNRADM